MFHLGPLLVAATALVGPAAPDIERLDLAELVERADGAIVGVVTAKHAFRIDDPLDGPELYFTRVTVEGYSLYDGVERAVELTYAGGWLDEVRGVDNSEAPAEVHTAVGEPAVVFWAATDNMGGGVPANAIYAAHGGWYRVREDSAEPVVLGRGEGYAVRGDLTVTELALAVAALRSGATPSLPASAQPAAVRRAYFAPNRRQQALALGAATLPVGQLDFRICDNFKDAAAGNNQNPDANFPGYQGAVMAIWKGCVEWGSGLHADGAGDPHQPGGLGSGGANFDPSFQGLADGVGPPNSNIHSAIFGCAPGLLAFTELPINTGWRIRYCDSAWTFDDGPGLFIGANKDLQGTAAHEFGHALGLGHSGDPAATMATPILGTGVESRSIEADDIAGVQALYGVAVPGKPRITGATSDGNTLTLSGENFAPTGNTVWFTQRLTGGDGTPIQVMGVPASGGVLSVAIPPTAGPGDVLVGTGAPTHESLSNAWPVGFPSLPCGASQYGLAVGGANTATISTASTPTAGSILTVDLTGFGADGPAMLLVSSYESATPLVGGTVLVYYANPIVNFPFTVTGGAAQLSFTLPGAGTVGYLQAGMVDPSQPGGWTLTNGLRIVVCP